MAFVGLNFTKITADRKPGVKGEIKINNNVNIKDVKKIDLQKGATQATLKFEFEFTSTYDPKVGSIKLEGESVYIVTVEQAKEAETLWKKKKQVLPGLITNVMNTILQKSHVEAIVISKSVGLPPPIQMPRVKAQ